MNKNFNWITVNSFMGLIAVGLNVIFVTRILTPKEIGVFALANIIMLFSKTITGLSFSSALIKFESNETYYKTAWTLNIIIGILTSLILFLLMPYIIDIFFVTFKEFKHYFNLLIILIPVNALHNLGTIELFKSNDQKKLAILGGFSEAFKQIVVLVCIYIFSGLKGLFIGAIIYSIINLVFTYLIAPIKIGFGLNYVAFKKLYDFSIWIHFKNILQFLSNQIDSLILANISQINTLGFYNRSRVLANLPKLIVDRINNVYLYPRFCDAENKNQKNFINFSRLIFSTIKIIFVFISLYLIFGKFFIELLLGDKWLPIDNFIVPLFIATILNSLAITINSFQRSKGNTKTEFSSLFVKVISFILLTPIFFIYFEVVGLAYSVLASSVLYLFYLIIIENNEIFKNIILKEFLKESIKIVLSYLILMVIYIYVLENGKKEINHLVSSIMLLLNILLLYPDFLLKKLKR